VKTHLFDVVLSAVGDGDTGDITKLTCTAKVIDHYLAAQGASRLIGESPEFSRLDDAIEWAKYAITAFTQGVEV
jgi:hypothetical protein